ncbi:MAG: glycosyltransferase [Nanoarchaeota archaeon]
MKKILLNASPEKMHPIWGELKDNPPKEYKFISNNQKISIKNLSSLKKNKLINLIYKSFLFKFINPLNLSEKMLSIPKDIDFIYSPDHIITKRFSWICDTEEAITFAGHNANLLKKNKSKIEKALSSKYCKKILPFTNFAKQSLEREFDTSLFKDKIEIIHFGTKIPKIKIKNNSKVVNIIFVGTANQTDPMIFNLKGGRESIEAFRILSKKYKNIRLKIVSNVPKNINTNIKGLEIIPLMDREKLFNLYGKSDIFLFPSYLSLGMTIIEAMGSGLPLVCSDMFGIPDSIDNKKNGFLINVKNKGKYRYMGPSINDFENFAEFIWKNNKEDIIKQIVKYISTLIESPKLRVKMGKESRKKYEKEFSTEVRNKKLKKIFDGITSK